MKVPPIIEITPYMFAVFLDLFLNLDYIIRSYLSFVKHIFRLFSILMGGNMNSVELVKKICKERKIPISRLEKDCGFANGYIRKLQEGKFPSDRLLIISEYLNLPMSYLVTGGEKSSRELTAKDMKDITKDVESIMQKLSDKENGPASYDGQDLSPESMDLFKEELEIALKRLKIINKEKYNPNKNKK